MVLLHSHVSQNLYVVPKQASQDLEGPPTFDNNQLKEGGISL